jgi:Flp pilus assembly pilin Flp
MSALWYALIMVPIMWLIVGVGITLGTHISKKSNEIMEKLEKMHIEENDYGT